jgi:hypothetical protein
MWISPRFKIYLIKEFQRLKTREIQEGDWNAKIFLTKMNYKIHTDAIKEVLIPPVLSQVQISCIYADEADVLNVALFGLTAAQRRSIHLDLEGNMRDVATIEQLIVLANLESLNAEYMRLGVLQDQRLQLLYQAAVTQTRSLLRYGERGVKQVDGEPLL